MLRLLFVSVTQFFVFSAALAQTASKNLQHQTKAFDSIMNKEYEAGDLDASETLVKKGVAPIVTSRKRNAGKETIRNS